MKRERIDPGKLEWERIDPATLKKKRFRPRESNLPAMNKWLRGIELAQLEETEKRRRA